MLTYLDPKCDVCGCCHWRPKRWRPSLCITTLKEELAEAKMRLGNTRGSWQLADDLRVVVKDQRNHIANLEAQLLPHLVNTPAGEQDALL